jgi:triacylglycerol lipase
MSGCTLLIGLFLGSFVSLGSAEDRPRETVVLLHGILNRPFVMKKIQHDLEKNGFRVLNWGYQSTEKTIQEYAADLHQFVESQQLTTTTHFVGFSLGSMVARYYLSTTPPAHLGRFVQIAPPNHGSQWIDFLSSFDTFRWVYGDKAVSQLKADSPFIKTLGIPTCEFGIITGGLGNDTGFNPVLDGDDDGAVALSSARLDGAKDFVQVHSEHTLLLAHDATTDNVVSFLKSGTFIHTHN